MGALRSRTVARNGNWDCFGSSRFLFEAFGFTVSLWDRGVTIGFDSLLTKRDEGHNGLTKAK